MENPEISVLSGEQIEETLENQVNSPLSACYLPDGISSSSGPGFFLLAKGVKVLAESTPQHISEEAQASVKGSECQQHPARLPRDSCERSL